MYGSSGLPNPQESYFFRHNYTYETLHSARKNVERLYPNRPIETEVNGDYRAKDSFSLRCVDIESELEKKTPAKEVLFIVKQWAPIRRKDLHADDIASGTIEYNKIDSKIFNRLISGDKQNGLTLGAVKRALHQLTKNGPPQEERVPLSVAMKEALGPLEQVDIFKPLSEAQKKKTPRVISAFNILHYGRPEKQQQFVQNLQETCSEGSRLVLGTDECRMDHLPDMLNRHGFYLDESENLKLKQQRVSNPLLCLTAMVNYLTTPVEPVVYLKTEQ